MGPTIYYSARPVTASLLREQIGELAESEEDVLIYAMFPDQAKACLEQRQAGTLQPEPLEPVPSEGITGNISTEFKITVHSESYDVHVTGASPTGETERRFYMTIDGVPEEISLESLGEFRKESGASKREKAAREGQVTTTMPGNIVDVRWSRRGPRSPLATRCWSLKR